MRDTKATIEWYRSHETEKEIGFDPDGRCLQICRTARDLPAVYPSALSAQEATPEAFRVYDVADVRQGMVGFFDDPNDSNPFGHIVTWVGRVKGEDRSSLSSLLGRTNSVVSGKIVVVRGDYFEKHWGDAYQFSATWLNGYAFPDFVAKQPVPAPALTKATGLRNALADLEKAANFHEGKGHTRLVKAIRRDMKSIRKTIREFS